MGWWDDLFKSPARRKAEQDRTRRTALTKARTALRRERRAIAKRNATADELRHKAVEYEKQGNNALAKQTVKRFVQMDKENLARTMALGNMEYTLEQVQAKDNYDEFVRGMRIVANIEELAHQSVDPDEVRERLTDLAQRNQDLIEPWLEIAGVDVSNAGTNVSLSQEEQEAYEHVMTDAAGELESTGPVRANPDLAMMDQELEHKMDAAIGKA